MRKTDQTKLGNVMSTGAKALVINCVVIFSLPLWYYMVGGDYLTLIRGQKQPLEVVKVNLEDPSKKVQKIKPKIKQRDTKLERLNNQSSSRFQLDLGVNSGGGSGVAIADKNLKNIIFSQNEVEVDPIRIGGRNPVVPPSFRDLGREGTVEVEVVVDETGQVLSSQSILETPPGYGLKESVITAIKTWKFKPAMVNQVPVKVRVIIPFLF